MRLHVCFCQVFTLTDRNRGAIWSPLIILGVYNICICIPCLGSIITKQNAINSMIIAICIQLCIPPKRRIVGARQINIYFCVLIN